MARKKYSKPTRAERKRASRGSAKDPGKPIRSGAVELAFGGLLGLAFATVALIFFGDWLIPRDRGETDIPDVVAEESRPKTIVIPEFTGEPAWERYAAASPEIGRRIPIAIVIDDLGLDRGAARRLAGLNGTLTLSFLPYAEGLQSQVDMVKEAGHEVLLHLPMEPQSSGADPGPHALYLGLSEEETLERMAWNMARIEGYVGVNNHMGSEYTENRSYMSMVLSAVGGQGLMFLDSRTSARSVGARLAVQMGVAMAERDVFLDNERDQEAIMLSLEQLERIAGDRGFAVAIGHPYPETMAALEAWTQNLEVRGYVLVPISVIVRFTESERLDG